MGKDENKPEPFIMRAFSDSSPPPCLELLIPEPLSFSLVTTETEITCPVFGDLLVVLYFKNLLLYVPVIFINTFHLPLIY